MKAASSAIAIWISSLVVNIMDPLIFCLKIYILSSENKFSHAAVWGLIPGYDLGPNEERNYPVTAMVANLAKLTAEKPALIRHNDVVTFFHEMGHVFHELLSRAKFSRFHGTAYVLLSRIIASDY
jgi:Zn-dependent oligopeptidase